MGDTFPRVISAWMLSHCHRLEQMRFIFRFNNWCGHLTRNIYVCIYWWMGMWSGDNMPRKILCGTRMTSWRGSDFRIIGHLWGESTGHSISQSPVIQNYDASFCLSKLLTKQSSCQWLETLDADGWDCFTGNQSSYSSYRNSLENRAPMNVKYGVPFWYKSTFGTCSTPWPA